MSELQAEQGAQTLSVSRTDAKSHRYRDVLIALIAFAVLALLPMLTGSNSAALVPWPRTSNTRQ